MLGIDPGKHCSERFFEGTIAIDDEIGKFPGRLDILLVHRNDMTLELLYDRLRCPAPLVDIALDAPVEADRLADIDEYLQIEKFPHGRAVEDMQPLNDHDTLAFPPLIDRDPFAAWSAGVALVVVDRDEDFLSIEQPDEVILEHIEIYRPGMVEVVPRPLLLRDVLEIEVIRIERDDHGLEIVEAAGQTEGYARLSRAGATGYSYEVGSVHLFKIRKNGELRQPPRCD